MVKRIVDTKFWTDMHVMDHYSVEDKYFYLYLVTNARSTQIGIYSLPIKVMSFETGYTTEVIDVLLKRFSEKYEEIIYSEETQEVTLLKSLKFSLLKGGRPVLNLLQRELSQVKDTHLIEATYEAMDDFWALSRRVVDKDVKELFLNELTNRKIVKQQNQEHHQNQSQKQDQIQLQSQFHNHSHHQESSPMNHDTIREDVNETAFLERYAQYLKESYPEITEEITPDNILSVYYKKMIGEMSATVDKQLRHWETSYPTSLLLEALSRSLKAKHILPYAASILENWEKKGVKTYRDVVQLDEDFSREKS